MNIRGLIFILLVSGMASQQAAAWIDINSAEYEKRAKIIKRLNKYLAFNFTFMYKDANGVTFTSDFNDTKRLLPYIITFYKDRDFAMTSYLNQVKHNTKVSIIGSMVVFSPLGDRKGLYQKIRYCLISLGFEVD